MKRLEIVKALIDEGASLEGVFAELRDAEGYEEIQEEVDKYVGETVINPDLLEPMNAQGKFVRPGFGENIRVLKWIIQRLSGEAAATKTPIGYLPAPGSLDLEGPYISWADLASAAHGWTPRPGSWRPSTSRSTSRPSTGTCPPGSGSCIRSSRTGSAEVA